MKILLIGNGGREHAIAWKVVNSLSFINSNSVLYFTAPNAGIEEIATPVNFSPTDIDGLLDFGTREKIDFAIIGPEIPLSLGMADRFRDSGLKVFGPSKAAAEIESSKIFAKELMQNNEIPTAKFKTFSKDEKQKAIEYISSMNFPVVIKADGLAAGKGVVIANDPDEALTALNEMTEEAVFGQAGFNFVVEEFLTGQEISVFVITDGVNYKILTPSQDHKRIGDNDTGPNTGGMGAYAPAKKIVNEELIRKIEERVIKKTLSALDASGRKFKGCLYCGLIVDEKNDPYVIEFNCRFGDPETQAVLPLVDSDFLELLIATESGKLADYELKIKNAFSCCIVAASSGYPGNYEKGKVIEGLEDAGKNCFVFHAGTKKENGNVVSNGGRVLSVVAVSDDSLKDAIDKAYSSIEKIKFENIFYRKDIGAKGL